MKELRSWLIALLLMLPVIYLYWSHFQVDHELLATGFIQSDMPSYMANAREYMDNSFDSIAYSNPFSDDPASPAIYFQPHIFLLALIWQWTGWEPQFVFLLFGFLSACLCLRIAIGLLGSCLDSDKGLSYLVLLCFCWGGGLLAISGLLYGFWDTGLVDWQDNIVKFDPFGGWWFLNFGRNLIFPTEAYYHAIFLGSIWAIVKKQYPASILLAALLSLSHPFTGIQVLAILTGWSLLESWVLGNKDLPRWYGIGLFALMLGHLAYYLIYLGAFPEHQSLAEQWRLDWSYHWWNIGPAYVLVGLMAAGAMFRRKQFKEKLKDPFIRLCLVWFAISFVLANHEWFLPPHQPLHFTRGYVWMPLFLLGSKTLLQWLLRLSNFRPRGIGFIGITLLIGLLLSDNLAWISWQGHRQSHALGQGQFLRHDQREAMDFLMKKSSPHTLLVSNDLKLSYLATIYTNIRPYYGHWASTPYASQKFTNLNSFFKYGIEPPAWDSREILLIYERAGSDVALDSLRGFQDLVWENESYEIFHRQAYVNP